MAIGAGAVGIDWRDVGFSLTIPPVELPSGFSWILEGDRLGLLWEAMVKPFVIDFNQGATGYRLRTGVSKQQLFAKAIGFKKPPYKVIDATAGFGADAAMLAALGCEVLAIERSPIVHALLADALRRAPHLKVRLQWGDARRFFSAVDAIYIDPMFPAQKKSALPSKPMQLLKALLDPRDEAMELLTAALASGCSRVVVKRPREAAQLDRAQLRHSYIGQAIRYDFYQRAPAP